MKWLLLLMVACVSCTHVRAKHDAWPQPAGIDAPSWPAASMTNIQAAPLPQGDVHQGPVHTPPTKRMAKSHLAPGNSHSSAGVSSISRDQPSGNDGKSATVPTGGLWGSTPHAAPVIAPAGTSSLPAELPADAGATLLPVAPRRLLVLFTAPKCKPCDDLKRLLAQCESQVYGDFVFREVDITTFDVGLNSAPWLALFDAGTEKQIEGPTAAPKTLGGLKELLTRWGTL